MQKLFITGAIASGKSTAACALRELGAVVVDADSIVHELMNSGTEVTKAIEAHFGPTVIGGDGAVDRSSLGRIVFQDAETLKELEAITHPAVVLAIEDAMSEADSQGSPCFVAEVQLLEKSGLATAGGRIMVIDSLESRRLQRLEQKGLSRSEAESRMRMGPQAEQLRGIADTVIRNDAGVDDLTRKVQEYYREWTRS